MSATPNFIKLCCGKNTRKIKLPSCFDELVLEATRTFPELKSLSKNNELIFFYIDDENEIIQIATKDDYQIAMQSDPIPTRFYTGSEISDVTQSINESEKVKQKLRASTLGGVPPLSFRQENSYYQGSECSKAIDEDQERGLDSNSTFSLVGHSDARVNPAELIRMQNQKKVNVERKESVESYKEIQALRDQMEAMKVSEQEKVEEEVVDVQGKVGVDFNQNTEVKEVKNTSVNTSAKVMSQVAMQSVGVEQSDKMCQQKPDLIPIALDAIPPKDCHDKASSPSHQAEQENLDDYFARQNKGDKKKCEKKKKKKKITQEKVLLIIEEEINKRVPVIFKELFQGEMEKKKGNKKDDAPKAVHKGIECDGCGVDPITGIRYKSIIQKNFDLCERCEASIDHPHALLKIPKPELAPSSLIVYKEEHDLPVQDKNFKNEDDGKFKRFDIDVREDKDKQQENDRIKAMKSKKSQEIVEQVKKVEQEPAAPPALDTSKNSMGGAWGRTGPKKCANKFFKCRYVKENPDGELPVKPGQHFEKIFTLRNDGDEPWPQSTSLCHVGGDYLGFLSQNVGLIDPGKEIEVKLHLVAPQEEGRYTGYLRMCEKPNESRFGHRFWCTVIVKKSAPEQQPPKKLVEEEKVQEKVEIAPEKNEEENPPESAFSEYVEKEAEIVAENEVSAIEKDYRFALLPNNVQEQVLNLFIMGMTTDVDKIFTLIEKHSKNIDQVADELFQSQG